MLEVTFDVQDTGEQITVSADGHGSVMQVAVENNVAGIEGECGGDMTCGTCHVYVESSPAGYSAETSDDEQDMLEVVKDRRPQSRLSCQLKVNAHISGLRVYVPSP